jgi:hypothetical protein
VSLNQYLVYTLTKAAAAEPTIAQRARFEILQSRFSELESEDALRELLAARS